MQSKTILPILTHQRTKIKEYYIYNSWKLICECASTAWHAHSLSVSIHTHTVTHEICWHGATTLQYPGLIRVVVKVMSSHWMQYDRQHQLANYFPAIIVLGIVGCIPKPLIYMFFLNFSFLFFFWKFCVWVCVCVLCVDMLKATTN